MEEKMSAQIGNVNVLEILLQISNDVSSIKTDITNLKNNQEKERADINKEILEVREDCQREINALENSLMSRINNLQTVQNNLVGEIDTIKHADEARDAKRWRTVIAFVITGLGGMLLAKLPDILSFIILTSKLNGGK